MQGQSLGTHSPAPSPLGSLGCLFNLYADYIMRNPGLEETQAGIKIAGRSIRLLINLRYADDTTHMEESEELKSLLKVKEETKKMA